VLFLCVLDLVVADAVEALEEHHDRGDVEAGDFGGVVDGAEIGSQQSEVRS
jgi:hypothetical protein